MIDKDTCEMIIEKYYDMIYKFCENKLHDEQAAKECTQEVFLLFYEKRKKLDLSENFKYWLYKSAEKICNNYRRKNYIKMENIDDYEDIIADESAQNFSPILKELYDILSPEDADLLLEYIEADKGKRKYIAKRMGITTIALYRRIDRIKKKVVDYYKYEEEFR